MDSQFDSWQQAYKQATPAVDMHKLLSQVKATKHRQQLKAIIDVFIGIGVSVYCLYASLWLANGFGQALIFGLLTPIPVAFSIWSFALRYRHWKRQTLDVNALLAFKRDDLTVQLKYWRVSAWVFALLYSALIVIAVGNYYLYDTAFIWLVQLAINGMFLLLVTLRYQYLKCRLSQKLQEIEAIQGE